MGKRRSLKPGGRDVESDEEEDFECEDVQEVLNPNQIAEIQSRKKLTAKRRVMDSESTTPSATPFLGFGGFKSLSTLTTQPSSLTNGTKTTFPTPTPPSKYELPKLEETKSLFSNIFNDSIIKPSQPPTLTVASSQLSETETSTNLKKLLDTEVNFINELSKLYNKYYGNTKQNEYKLPQNLINKQQTSNENYARLLMELNKRCSKWISKHVEENPFVYLTPIFIDYLNYLIKLEKEIFPATITAETNGVGVVNGNHKTTNSEITIKAKNIEKFAFKNHEKEETEDEEEEEEDEEPLVKVPLTSGTTSMKFTPISLLDNNNKLNFNQSTATTVASPFSTSQTLFKFGSSNKSSNETSSLSSASSSTDQTPPSPAPASTTFSMLQTTKPVESTKLNFFGSSAPTQISATPKFSIDSATTPSATFSFQSAKKDEKSNTSMGFSFGSSATPTPVTTSSLFQSTTTSTTTPSSNLFSFLNKTSETPSTTTSSFKPFSFGSTSTSTAAPPTTSLFGGSTFSGFSSATSSNIFGSTGSTSIFPSSSETTGGGGGEQDGENEPYEPPKPEFTEIKEEGSVFTKRVKLFYFNTNENKYTDRGVGNLHLKLLNNGEKTQLIVRADTSLGNILLNVNLTKQVPVNKIGSKDVSIICIANPPIPKLDDKTPCKFLIKVKTEQDAEELLNKLNSMKK